MEDESGSRPPLYQIGNVRTNCLDNLDRTNVVQSALAKWTLTRQLRELSLLSPTDTVENYPEFMTVYRNSASGIFLILTRLKLYQSVGRSC